MDRRLNLNEFIENLLVSRERFVIALDHTADTVHCIF
jgi:hypothetical protein